jgi:carboxypeptidase Taq
MHWSTGSFGYFPTYSLGSMLSAQLMEAYTRQGPPDDYVALLAWLRTNVHSHGQRYKTGELIARATGGPLTPDAFVRYASKKYGELWS